MVQLSSTIIQTAKESGVKHLVKVSGAGAELEAITVAKWHRAIEKEMEQAGMTYTFLRPNSFMHIPLLTKGHFTHLWEMAELHILPKEIVNAIARTLSNQQIRIYS